MADVVQDGSTPPWTGRVMHAGSTLSDEEKKVILE